MIESLHSPHIARVKALLGSRGVRERRESGLFVAEGLQSIREALHGQPAIETLYLTHAGRSRLEQEGCDLRSINSLDVTDAVMEAMTSTVTPQGVLALCALPQRDRAIVPIQRAIYLWQIQDPGNAGTILRTADAFGIDAVLVSPESVDMYSPKVVRATAGSLWHINLYEGIELTSLSTLGAHLIALDSEGDTALDEISFTQPTIAVFGNEARGLDSSFDLRIERVCIPMPGKAESLNLSVAAGLVMYAMRA